jgi:Na+-transporting methylmalonyl-CoA/oxaloacetate decarboxylase gamma subunit
VDVLIFFSCLGGLLVLIWLLSLISSAVTSNEADQKTEAKQKGDAASELQNNTQHEGFSAIENAINSYRTSRESQSRQEDKRDNITVVLVGVTALFAAAAAVAAIVSAVIFQNQLNEMRSTGTQTDTLIEANKKTR